MPEHLRPDVVHTEALRTALADRLAAEFPLRAHEQMEIEAAIRGELGDAAASSPPLSAGDRAEVNRSAWRPVVYGCVVSMLHHLFAQVFEVEASADFCDEDLRLYAAAAIAAPFHAQRFGLDDSNRQRAAELTAELFCDRARFLEVTRFRQNNYDFDVIRRGDVLSISSVFS